MSRRNLYLLAALVQVVWGLNPAASKLVLDEIPVELCTTLRWTIAGLALSLALVLRTGRITRLSFDLVRVAALGILAYALASAGMLYGLKMGGVVNFALVATFNPVLTSVIAVALLGERPSRAFLAALAAGVAGMILVVIGKYQVSSLHLALGSAAVIVASQGLDAVAFISSKRFQAKLTTAQYLVIAQLSAALALWLAQLTYFHQAAQIAQLSLRGWAALLFLSIVAGIGCYGGWYWLLRRHEGHKLALFDWPFTIAAAISGHYFFGEPVTGLMAAGGCLVVASIFIGNRARPSASRA